MTLGDAAAAPPGADPDEADAALWRAARDGGRPAAREALFAAHAPFARMIAGRHFRDRRSGDIEFADLSQLAFTGLLEAIDQFDPAHGVPFRRYAGRRISGAIVDGLAKMSEVRQQISTRNRMRAERARSLCEIDVRKATGAEAMAALIETAVGLALGFMLEGTGLYVAAQDERESTANAYEHLAWKETVQLITAEVAKLPEREREIIRRHYLDGLNFEQIADLLGVSKGRASQLHKVAIDLLRKRLKRAQPFILEQ